MKAGLIGHGIAGSLTPAMHEAEGRALGLSYQYDLLDVSTERFRNIPLSRILDQAEADSYVGLNITHPFKVEVVEYLSELSEIARTIGAVNTVVFQGGRRFGFNTDYSGFLAAVQTVQPALFLGQVLLLGAGGAGTAVALALIDAGVNRIVIHDKTPGRGAALVAQLSAARPDASVAVVDRLVTMDLSQYDGVVNATPMGMNEHPGTAIDVAGLPETTWVADIVYFPLETELLVQAKKRGCQTINGTGMAIHQAVDAFSFITGKQADPTRFMACIERLISQKQIPDEELVP
ncbi:shikimate dehydrogenase [Candidatus Halocynthiibacter alkanivorans]|uniref:shikimate dehydrogenase n=1 Tax=Candidatus Halocynthiibacter alkanivorans TaxID=2267619 RepID=UPI000DF266C3|nr:shikimate dehydrogenase [Candidatus Halocynthiibacter alkanivorans]